MNNNTQGAYPGMNVILYPAVQQRAQGVMGRTHNTECRALFPCAPNGSKQGRLGLRHMQKKSSFEFAMTTE